MRRSAHELARDLPLPGPLTRRDRLNAIRMGRRAGMFARQTGRDPHDVLSEHVRARGGYPAVHEGYDVEGWGMLARHYARTFAVRGAVSTCVAHTEGMAVRPHARTRGTRRARRTSRGSPSNDDPSEPSDIDRGAAA